MRGRERGKWYTLRALSLCLSDVARSRSRGSCARARLADPLPARTTPRGRGECVLARENCESCDCGLRAVRASARTERVRVGKARAYFSQLTCYYVNWS